VVRDALDQRWGLERRLAALERETASLEKSLASLVDLRTGRITRLIAIYGFPIFVSSALAPILGKVLNAFLLGAPGDKDAPGWLVLTCFGAVAALLAVCISVLIAGEDPLRSTRPKARTHGPSKPSQNHADVKGRG
jgi:hypothetical protein